ncbi:hypothetical protein CDD81_5445 [Ophiocordyceps australis]|uniref:Yippee/Mis18/Cereblon domain-containing protein n=1 Tax=Ophiocordyceps australis TaxID=1399860 RepID=A0A2C5XIF8_9HYPO|nr:hypothetical protein CDD81_5445 [Ophiocordyceps australis]
MDLVSCKCVECDALIGRVANLWTQIGKKYMVHGQAVETVFCVATSGSIRQGDSGTLVGGCQLQDAQCQECEASLGQKCLQSPRNHVLADGQIIFRIASLVLRPAADMRRTAEPNMTRVLKLKADAQADNACNSHADLLQVQQQLDSQRHDIARIGASAVHLVANFDTAIARVEGQVRQLDQSVDSLRDDVRLVTSDMKQARWDCQSNPIVSRLDQQLQTTDRVVTELRQALHTSKSDMDSLREQLAATQKELCQAKDESRRLKDGMDQMADVVHQSLASSKDCASDLSMLRREVQQLRAELAQERAQQSHPPPFCSHELDVLASSITKIGNRASQIESLQMEFELFRSRVQRIEARVNTRSCLSRECQVGSRHQESSTRKRDDDGLEHESLPLKRMAPSSCELGSAQPTGKTTRQPANPSPWSVDAMGQRGQASNEQEAGGDLVSSWAM